MRGKDKKLQSSFNHISPNQRGQEYHPVRSIQKRVAKAIGKILGPFAKQHLQTGRPSLPPEHLLRALLLKIFYMNCSACMLTEQLHYNLLFRWFVALSMDDPIEDRPSLSRYCLLNNDIAAIFFQFFCNQADQIKLLFYEQFTIPLKQINEGHQGITL